MHRKNFNKSRISKKSFKNFNTFENKLELENYDLKKFISKLEKKRLNLKGN